MSLYFSQPRSSLHIYSGSVETLTMVGVGNCGSLRLPPLTRPRSSPWRQRTTRSTHAKKAVMVLREHGDQARRSKATLDSLGQIGSQEEKVENVRTCKMIVVQMMNKDERRCTLYWGPRLDKWRRNYDYTRLISTLNAHTEEAACSYISHDKKAIDSPDRGILITSYSSTTNCCWIAL